MGGRGENGTRLKGMSTKVGVVRVVRVVRGGEMSVGSGVGDVKAVERGSKGGGRVGVSNKHKHKHKHK